MSTTIEESPAPVPVQAPCEKQPGQLDEETRAIEHAAGSSLGYYLSEDILGFSAWQWNDADGRTFHQVIDLLDRVLAG
jgi:hypothetical protein